MTTLDTRSTLRDGRSVNLPQLPDPTDRAHVPAASLVEAVQAAVRAISSNSYHPVCSPGAGMAFQAPALAALLSFYYASDIYSSADIEDAMGRDAEFRIMCGGEFPDKRTLRKFRRHNREVIEQCLYKVLQFIAKRNGTHMSEGDLLADVHQRVTTAIAMDMED